VEQELILKLEALAQLELSDTERQILKSDLDNMIKMINKLQEINTDGLAPLVHLGTDRAALRSDQIIQSLSKEDALENAKFHDGHFFLTPKVIEK
jgi:aspartyl-tRNA(Asn)/glutamyl-tRNA(Gln) amidotransferase subunit C